MDFSEVIRKRRMVRHFTNEPVHADVIARICDVARRAPSAGYSQGQALVVVTDEAKRREIARLVSEDEYVKDGFGPWISQAPVQVVACVSEAAYHRRYQEPDKLDAEGNETEWPVPYWFMDIGCTVMALLLAVVNEGLAAGFAGAETTERRLEMQRLLGIPDEFTAVGVLPIGHGVPATTPSSALASRRKPTNDFAHYEQW